MTPLPRTPQRPPPATTAASYAVVLRDVVAGRRRVRIEGRWADGDRGSVHAGAHKTLGDEQLTWSVPATSR